MSTYKRKTRVTSPLIIKKRKPGKEGALALFLRVLAELYPQDVLAPGISIAYLPKDSKFYGSIKRYDSLDGTRFQVLLSVKEDTLPEVIQSLVQGWRTNSPAAIAFASRRSKRKRAKSFTDYFAFDDVGSFGDVL